MKIKTLIALSLGAVRGIVDPKVCGLLKGVVLPNGLCAYYRAPSSILNFAQSGQSGQSGLVLGKPAPTLGLLQSQNTLLARPDLSNCVALLGVLSPNCYFGIRSRQDLGTSAADAARDGQRVELAQMGLREMLGAPGAGGAVTGPSGYGMGVRQGRYVDIGYDSNSERGPGEGVRRSPGGGENADFHIDMHSSAAGGVTGSVSGPAFSDARSGGDAGHSSLIGGEEGDGRKKTIQLDNRSKNIVITIGSTDKKGNTTNDVVSKVTISPSDTSGGRPSRRDEIGKSSKKMPDDVQSAPERETYEKSSIKPERKDTREEEEQQPQRAPQSARKEKKRRTSKKAQESEPEDESCEDSDGCGEARSASGGRKQKRPKKQAEPAPARPTEEEMTEKIEKIMKKIDSKRKKQLQKEQKRKHTKIPKEAPAEESSSSSDYVQAEYVPVQKTRIPVVVSPPPQRPKVVQQTYSPAYQVQRAPILVSNVEAVSSQPEPVQEEPPQEYQPQQYTGINILPTATYSEPYRPQPRQYSEPYISISTSIPGSSQPLPKQQTPSVKKGNVIYIRASRLLNKYS